MEWQYGAYGGVIGLSGISVSDIDGDGTPEMVMQGGYNFWYIVKLGISSNREERTHTNKSG